MIERLVGSGSSSLIPPLQTLPAQPIGKVYNPFAISLVDSHLATMSSMEMHWNIDLQNLTDINFGIHSFLQLVMRIRVQMPHLSTVNLKTTPINSKSQPMCGDAPWLGCEGVHGSFHVDKRVKLCDPLLTCAILECLRDEQFIIKRYTNKTHLYL